LDDEQFSIHDLAKKLHLSRSQVHRKIKALTGMSTSIYIRHIRLHKAKELLASSDLSIAEIAYEVGFNTPVYFSQVFKETFGKSPNATRK
jgi:AraC-like DNA-binding protein